MSWRDRLRKASFRDVPFAVRAHEADFGRRVQVHEFPDRDKPFAEDLGRKTRAIALEAFVLGDDYMAARDRLLAALERPGPGLLVHPYLGELRVSVLKAKLAESTPEGGMARFALEFAEAGEATFPDSGTGAAAAVAAASDTASKAAQSSFAARHKVSRRPAFVAAASASIFTTAQGSFTAAVGKVRSVATQVALLQKQVDAARRDVTTLLFAPASAAQALVGNLQQLVRSVAASPREALALARVFYRFGLDLAPVAASTSSRAAQAQNQAEMVQLVRTAAAAEGARAATTVAFESFNDAAAVRDELAELLDGLLLAATTDALYDALRGLRAATVRDISERGANLAQLVAWTPRITMPAAVVAQQLYADASREGDLLARNAVRHPLFVPGGQALEVLTDAA